VRMASLGLSQQSMETRAGRLSDLKSLAEMEGSGSPSAEVMIAEGSEKEGVDEEIGKRKDSGRAERKWSMPSS